jgi:hypothetical protein
MLALVRWQRVMEDVAEARARVLGAARAIARRDIIFADVSAADFETNLLRN